MATTQDLIAAFNKSAKKQLGGVGLAIADPSRLPSGIFNLDLALGGGIPLGRCTEVFGLEGVMKTTLTLLWVAAHQRLFPQKRCVVFDVEGHLLQSWAEKFGVLWSELMYVQPENAEQVVDLMEGFMVADDVGLIVLDSIASMVTQKELDKEGDWQGVGGSGLIINKLYRKMTHAFKEGSRIGVSPTVAMVNQIRAKIGVMYGSPETTVGGPSMRFLASIRIRLSASDEFAKKTDKLPSFKHVRGSIPKNKVPILNKNFEYLIALRDIPELGLKFGEAYDWTTILLYLKKLELLTKVKEGWQLGVGVKMIYEKQEDIEQKYQTDLEFRQKIRGIVISQALQKGDPVVESSETSSEGE